MSRRAHTSPGGGRGPEATVPAEHDEWLGLPAAAELAGVHYMTAYKWVRTSRLKAEKSGGTWKVRLSDLNALTRGDKPAGGTPVAPGGRQQAPYRGGRLAPMTDALLRGDQGGAWLLVEESRRAGVDPVDLLCELIEPAMIEVGRRWQKGEVSVAEEHRATVVATRLIGRLGPSANRPGRSRGVVVIGAVEGNRHGLGAAIVADVFRAAGYDACELGADVPADEMASVAAAAGRLAAVCLSIAVDGTEESVASTVSQLRSITDAPLLVGGPAVVHAAWADAVGADGWCADGRGAPALLERLTRLRDRSRAVEATPR